MSKKKQNQEAAPESGAASSSGVSTVKFIKKQFRYKGVEYNSVAVEKAAKAKDQDALTLIAKLVQIGSGVVSVTGEKGDQPNE